MQEPRNFAVAKLGMWPLQSMKLYPEVFSCSKFLFIRVLPMVLMPIPWGLLPARPDRCPRSRAAHVVAAPRFQMKVPRPSHRRLRGRVSDLAIGADGRPVISLYDNTAHAYQTTEFNLKLLRCADVSFTSISAVIVDETADVGQHNSVAIRSNGMPVIAYRDEGTKSLRVAHCTDEKCLAKTFTLIDSTSNTGEYVELIIGADGLGVMAYYDQSSDSLKVTHCSTIECSAFTTTVIDNSGASGRWPAITIGQDGNPIIFFEDRFKTALRMVRSNDAACTTSIAGSLFPME